MLYVDFAVVVLNPILAFWAGVFFHLWMRDRVRRREIKWGRPSPKEKVGA
jgi:hypothetical protein